MGKKIIDVNEADIEETGFFCYMSKKKTIGYKNKLEWLKSRFSEGMKLKILGEGKRGVIEYIPGEHAWRPVKAEGYMFIHCLWVVGKSKGNGYAKELLNECIKDARKLKMKGVAMVTSEKVWLMSKKFLVLQGFESVDKAPPSFELMVNKFDNSNLPSFTGNWEKKAERFGSGLTVIQTDQCPYIDDAVKLVLEVGKEIDSECSICKLESSQDVRDLTPSAYGTFSIVYNGRLLSYHYLTRKDLLKQIGK